MPQAEDMCQNVIMVHRGRKVLDETLSAIRSQYDPKTIAFDPLDSQADLSQLAQISGVERVEQTDTGYKILLTDGTNPAEAMRRILDIATPARLELARPRLEDIFINLVSSAIDTAEERTKLRADLHSANSGEATA
jgi:ABC-type uncharacterized transport system ATPase subunit